MARANIKTKSGAVVTVEGTPKEIASLIAKFEAADKPEERRAHAARRPSQKAGPSSLILNLRDKGFFNKPRSLAGVAEALQEQGYLYPVTTLSGVVLKLLKTGDLHRKKVEGKWVYGR